MSFVPFPSEGGSVNSELNKHKQETANRFQSIEGLMYAVVAALVLTAISALISVGAIVIDQLHFNNQTYRDYSITVSAVTSQKIEIQNLKDRISNFERNSCR